MFQFLQTPQGVYNFICESGLLEIFSDKKIKDLNDFVFGIEVGFDSNTRKNRGGKVIAHECFDFSYCTKNMDSIFKRMLGSNVIAIRIFVK